MAAGTQVLGPSFIPFPSHKQVSGSEMEQQGLEQVSVWDAGSADGGLACYAIIALVPPSRLFLC